MILVRTKLFGFYDQSGKLLEKYAKGGKFNNKFQKWKNNIIDQYQHELNRLGSNNKLAESEIESILREQSKARDDAANYLIKRRANHLKKITNREKFHNDQLKLTDEYFKKYAKEAETNPELKEQLDELVAGNKVNKKWIEDLRNSRSENIFLNNTGNLGKRRPDSLVLVNSGAFENRNRKYGPGQLLKNEVQNSTGYFEQNKLNDFYEKKKHEAFLKEQKIEAEREAAKQAALDKKKKEKELKDAQDLTNKLNKQVSDLTSQNKFLQQQQGIHAKNYNNLSNQNKDLTNKNKDITNKYNASVEENKRQSEKHTKEIADKDAEISKGQKKNKELEDSNRDWRIGVGVASGLGLAGLGYGIYKGTREDKNKK